MLLPKTIPENGIQTLSNVRYDPELQDSVYVREVIDLCPLVVEDGIRLDELGALPQCLGRIVPYIDPLVFVAHAVGAVLVLLLLTADHDDMRLDFIVACDGGTEVSPLSVDLNMLVQREFGLCQRNSPRCVILRISRLTQFQT